MFDTEQFIREIELRPSLYNVQSKDYTNKEIKARCWAEVGEAVYRDWNTISRAVKDTRAKELIKKWKAVRDSFVKDHKQANSEKVKPNSKKKRYVYADQLQFLIPHVKIHTSTTSNNEHLTASEIEAIDDDSQDQPAVFHPEHNQDSRETIASTSTGVPDSKPATTGKRKLANQQSRARKKQAVDKSLVSPIRDLALILSESLTLQKEERQADIYGHRAFLMSFVPILNSLPLHTAMGARLQMTQLMCAIHAHSTGYSNGTNGVSAPAAATTATPTSGQSDSSDDSNSSDDPNE